MDTLFRGIVIGFAIAAPVGPIGLLCITRTLSLGFRTGFISGLGAACADAIYGIVAAAGLSAVVLAAHRFEHPLHVAGALVLVAMGVRTLLSRPADAHAVATEALSPHAAFLSTFGLTVVNPATMISFAAIVSAARVSGAPLAATLFVGGVLIGSACWWLTLAGSVSLLHKRVTIRMRRIVDLASGTILALAGLALLWY